MKIRLNNHWHPEFFILLPVVAWVVVMVTIIAFK